MARRLCVGCVLLVVLTVGCTRHSGADPAPTACTDGTAGSRIAAIQAALRRAPAPVRLSDGTRISDCLAGDADSGDLQNVGLMLLTLTQRLVDGKQDHRSLLELGYLVGAVQRGATRSQVDGEIERRIDQEVTDAEARSSAFRRGQRAGRANG
ncbi:MAG TPA: hypothetical protein VJU60_08910 [Thermoleophilaceae bacterium]|nr:hypothetical protein [Thermoleophilaceae bacterium]